MSEDVQIIRKGDNEYPLLLAEIHDPPEQLFVRGIIPPGICFAVVGSRVPSAYGKTVTAKLVEPLAAAGVVIVSGLAYGIDALAHEAALAVGGKTIAVLGTGVDETSLYPRQHRKLARRIVEAGGAVISEYPSGTGPEKYHFPARNRIIAGLSRGVLIIEAKEKSGALITADLALKENRDVFAVPGPITSPTSAGPNQLIQTGAKPVLSPDDILVEYELTQLVTGNRELVTMKDEERRLLDILASDAVHVDAIGMKLNLPAPDVSAMLVALELKGLIKNVGGGRYART